MLDDKFPTALPIDTVLAGQFIIEEVLGQGGFGITYKAKDHKTNEAVAIKEYFPDTMVSRKETTVIPYTGEREENFKYGLDCFLREAETLAKYVDVDGIVSIRSYFEENGTAYFVMDFVEGESFDEYIKEKGGKIDYEDAKNVLLPVVDALSYVHKDGIVHRDVTPDNIFITKDGKVKLLDFGAARYSIGDKSRSLDVVLKHGYAPKEQYTRHGKQGPFTDIYTVGVCFYRAITGRLPADSIDRLEEDDVVLPSTLGVKIESFEEEAILKAMAVQPADRFKTMDEFKTALLPAPVVEEVKEETKKEKFFCPKCGSPVEKEGQLCKECQRKENIQAELNKELDKTSAKETADSSADKKTEKKKGSKKKITILAAILGIVIIAVIAMYAVPAIKRSQKYKEAEKYYSQGNYSQAARLYEELGDNEKKIDAIYEQANKYYNSGRYSNAATEYKKAGDYKDAKDNVKKSNYMQASKHFKDGDYDKAISLFTELGDYTPDKKNVKSSVMVQECNYQKACKLIEDGDVDAAIEILEKLGSYSSITSTSKDTAKDKIFDCKCVQAEELVTNKKYDKAIEIYEKLKSDGYGTKVESKLKDAKYGYIQAHYNSTDAKTREYVDELFDANYSGASEAWTDLYSWLEIKCIVPEKIDGGSYYSYSLYSDVDHIYCYYNILKQEEKTFYVQGQKDSDDPTEKSECGVKDDSGLWYIGWSSPGAWTGTHTATFIFTDNEGHILAEESVTVVND